MLNIWKKNYSPENIGFRLPDLHMKQINTIIIIMKTNQ